MIMLCERCYALIGDDEPVVRRLHALRTAESAGATATSTWAARPGACSRGCVAPGRPEPGPDRGQGIDRPDRTGRRLPEG